MTISVITIPDLVNENQGFETYIGIKGIQAKPMTRQEYNDLRGWTLPSDENGDDDGYLVVYSNKQCNVDGIQGYVSWSPKDVFDEAHAKVIIE